MCDLKNEVKTNISKIEVLRADIKRVSVAKSKIECAGTIESINKMIEENQAQIDLLLEITTNWLNDKIGYLRSEYQKNGKIEVLREVNAFNFLLVELNNSTTDYVSRGEVFDLLDVEADLFGSIRAMLDYFEQATLKSVKLCSVSYSKGFDNVYIVATDEILMLPLHI